MTRHDTSADHARHDALLIAALAAGDPEADERSRAETLVATCPACAELGRDLRAITAATTAAELPVPGRPRAFTLRPADAARLRPAGWRGLVRRFASPGWALTRPLAAGLTTLGLAGLLVAALPSLVPLSGGAAGAPASPVGQQRELTVEDYTEGAGPPASPAASAPAPSPPAAAPALGQSGSDTTNDGSADPAPSAASDDKEGQSPAVSPLNPDTVDRLEGGPRSADEGLRAAQRDGPTLLVIVAGTSLLVGIALFGLRWAGRRLS